MTGAAALLAVSAGLAAAGAAALLPAPARGPGTAATRSAARWWPAGAAAVLVLGLALLLGGAGSALAVLVAVSPAVAVAVRLVRATRAERRAVATGEQVALLCEHLAGDLRAGRPPGPALADAARTWPPADAVARAHRVGADVPAAWRALSAAPGAADLRLVAAVWEVAHRTGHGLAEALQRCVEDQTRARATRRVVRSELASARATARLVALLPVPALLLGASTGAAPWQFLLGSPVGLVCLGLGLLLGAAGLTWIERLAADARRRA
ncbi:type II secretion system F family protein [Nocardioides bruguierae]|uniref:type II secretion system F family protein n=1 Tax=Nocardioides bruguierae TaxID=2945102 RepID=UPI002021DA05|nr:type II secretion system F family protein [Nocardioides bruguierae]MCL8027475.1 type II secretion system F family protein [Nocardioides bruguierae]